MDLTIAFEVRNTPLGQPEVNRTPPLSVGVCRIRADGPAAAGGLILSKSLA
jgi:hypothetical protein